MNYIPVIGLELHAELLTESKIFCSCPNTFGGTANERICPRCAGFPGALPVLNREVVLQAVRAGICLDCEINRYSAFDRKNYFYPDLPKAYQITQFYHPICGRGAVEAEGKRFRIERIHIEEDAGKLIHEEGENRSYADYNRCGVPLIEIVTEADFRSAEEVVAFIGEVALRLKYAGVCDARLEQGSLRADVNISLMPEGSDTFGTRAEIKNLNSTKSIGRAIAYEIDRQTELLSRGERVRRETRRFEENSGKTVLLRAKEDADDYRYFPEPDLPAVRLEETLVERLRAERVRMPRERIAEYTEVFGISRADAELIVAEPAYAEYFEQAAACTEYRRETANLMLGALNRYLNDHHATVQTQKCTPKELAELAKMSAEGKISKATAREILTMLAEKGGSARQIAEENHWLMQKDTAAAERAVSEVLSEHADCAEDYRRGTKKAFAFLMGQALRKVGQSADPKQVKELLENMLEK